MELLKYDDAKRPRAAGNLWGLGKSNKPENDSKRGENSMLCRQCYNNPSV